MSDTMLAKRRTRYVIVGVVFALAATAILIRYARVMLSGPAPLSGTAPHAAVERGPILDRNGRILAIQTDLDTVSAWKPSIRDLEATARVLGETLGRNPREIQALLARTTGYAIVQRTITPSQSMRLRELIAGGSLPGIRLEPDQGRSYPERGAAAGLIGYVGVDNVGLSGIEYVFNGELSPDQSVGGQAAVGNQVFLTLDLAVQTVTDELAERLLRQHDANWVTILVAEAGTGALLAYSSLPSFDPNHFRDASAELRRNRPIATVYEPGSVFKVFSIAAFMELGGITAADRFNTTGGYVSERGQFRISDLADYGSINAEQIIKFSSNVGAAYASERIDGAAFHRMLTLFGFGHQTGVLLNGEERGLLAPPERWSGRTRQTMSIGQEIGVTALQVVAAATTLANDGVLLRPQVIDRIVSPQGQVLRRFTREPVHEVLSPDTARAMLAFMRSAPDRDGTAWRVQVDGVNVSVKTGTAEVFDTRSRSYSRDHFLASALALFPTEAPQLIVYVVIDHPRGESIYGGRIAAPAIDELAEFLVPYWGIPRHNDTVIEHGGRVVTHNPILPEVGATIPDFTGLPLRTLLPLFARSDLLLEVEGHGWVVEQHPPPGTAFEAGTRLYLRLR